MAPGMQSMLGYDQPLYVLPFDHRHSYGHEVFGFNEPMPPEQIAIVAASKGVIYEGFKRALKAGVPKDRAAILVDEEFGTKVLRDAHHEGFHFALPLEKSGEREFHFEFDDYEKRIEDFDPTFVKVLVRWNPGGDAAMNARQAGRLKKVSDYCHRNKRVFMFELLVPPEQKQLDKFGGDHKVYDREVRPGLMITAIEELQESGVEPDIWKIEGLDRKEDCVKLTAAARRDGRDNVGCIVLGRGEDEARVITWLQTAAPIEGFIGFAVGRSTFLQPIVDYRAKKLSADDAADEIARRFREWVDVFEKARASVEA
ncbi:MAG TPA: DUF2090 domain-containing protein [Pirellulales bacterium]|jgi:5-dehydro-2-deoxygluconokinase|nr:DUF2090 domain-containing protein [Pirellulales bacterium]